MNFFKQLLSLKPSVCNKNNTCKEDKVDANTGIFFMVEVIDGGQYHYQAKAYCSNRSKYRNNNKIPG
jgi:hypothetical protein